MQGLTMSNRIAGFFAGVAHRFPVERSIFDFFPASRRESAEDMIISLGLNDTPLEAWRKDWENIGMDFRKAVGVLNCEEL